MKNRTKPVFFMLFFTGVILLTILVMQPLHIVQFQDYIAFLFPKGIIALKQRNLLFISQVLMLLVVVPVYILTFVFSWIYRADNPKGNYDPDLIDNTLAEVIWWGFPLVMTIALSVLTWIKTEQLDPYKPIASDKKTITIQAVALQWKWLFIYPEEKVATVNFLQIPVDTPIHFEITADAPMNSFWIPDLGGQIYAMPKMKTELYLMANQTGNFRGSSANLSGEGFADMHFIARGSSMEDYQTWLQAAKNSEMELNFESYESLAKPESSDKKVYKLSDEHLFHQIIDKYMKPKIQDKSEE